jgi:hypothetical protein
MSTESTNPKTGMTLMEMKEFVRHHLEEFGNRKNLAIADVNFAPEFVDHGSDVPSGLPSGPAGKSSSPLESQSSRPLLLIGQESWPVRAVQLGGAVHSPGDIR